MAARTAARPFISIQLAAPFSIAEPGAHRWIRAERPQIRPRYGPANAHWHVRPADVSSGFGVQQVHRRLEDRAAGDGLFGSSQLLASLLLASLLLQEDSLPVGGVELGLEVGLVNDGGFGVVSRRVVTGVVPPGSGLPRRGPGSGCAGRWRRCAVRRRRDRRASRGRVRQGRALSASGRATSGSAVARRFGRRCGSG